jgi:hypothetical protein
MVAPPFLEIIIFMDKRSSYSFFKREYLLSGWVVNPLFYSNQL